MKRLHDMCITPKFIALIQFAMSQETFTLRDALRCANVNCDRARHYLTLLEEKGMVVITNPHTSRRDNHPFIWKLTDKGVSFAHELGIYRESTAA